MRVYIAYKFTKVQNKERVTGHLQQLDAELSRFFTVFILIKDYYKWSMRHKALHKSLIQMIKEIYRSDAVLFLVDGPETSHGMFVEELIATFLMKKRLYVVSTDVMLPRRKNIVTFDVLSQAMPQIVSYLNG